MRSAARDIGAPGARSITLPLSTLVPFSEDFIVVGDFDATEEGGAAIDEVWEVGVDSALFAALFQSQGDPGNGLEELEGLL